MPQTRSTISGRVAGVVAFEDLVDAARVLQRLVDVRVRVDRRAAGAVRSPRATPGSRGGAAVAASRSPDAALDPPSPSYCQVVVVVAARVLVEAGEQPVEVLGVAEVLVDDRGRVGVA